MNCRKTAAVLSAVMLLIQGAAQADVLNVKSQELRPTWQPPVQSVVQTQNEQTVPASVPAQPTAQPVPAVVNGRPEGVPDTVQWYANLRYDYGLRTEMDKNSKCIRLLHKEVKTPVYACFGDWCYVIVDGDEGYVETNKLDGFYRVGLAPVPGYAAVSGLAIVNETVELQVEKYAGNTVAPGTVIAVSNEQGLLPMMRRWTTLPEGTFTYLPFVPWQDAQPGDVIAAYTTWYNEKTGGSLAANRRYNIQEAVNRTDGATTGAGEEYSYNRYCGPYNVSNGYVAAPNISATGVGVGGGVCQLSTTIYNAVMLLPVKINEWRVHQKSGVPYVPVNLDASVSSSMDLRFNNLLDYPITFHCMTQDGALTVIVTRAVTE